VSAVNHSKGHMIATTRPIGPRFAPHPGFRPSGSIRGPPVLS